MEPTESLALFIADERYENDDWDAYFAPSDWLRNGLPELANGQPQLTIDSGAFTTVEAIKGVYSEVTFVTVSLWYHKPANSTVEYEAAMAISRQIMEFAHDSATTEGIWIQGQGRNHIDEPENSLGRIRMSFRLMEVE